MTAKGFTQGHKIYKCEECGKMTRKVGDECEDLGLCHDCYEMAEWENFLSDGGDPAEVPADILAKLEAEE